MSFDAPAFDDVLSFIPLFGETLARIRARMDQDVNNGVDPSDPAYVDTREGGFYWDLTEIVGLEAARLWDAIGSETVAAAFPSLAWGDYLDEHGTTFALTRKAATPATGKVLFAGTGGIAIPAGTSVASEPSSPSLDAISFTTDALATTSNAVAPPTPTLIESDTGGHLPPATYYYHVTVYTVNGESMGSPDMAVTVNTTTGQTAISWSAVVGAVGYRIYRTTEPGSLGYLIWDTGNDGDEPDADPDDTSYTDLGGQQLGPQEPDVDTTAGVLVPVTAATAGSDTNLGANSIIVQETPIDGINFVTNPAATIGGTDAESDDAFRERILGMYQGHGAGNVADYIGWLLAYDGVERAACVPVWNGAGTVLAIPMLADGSPVPAALVTQIQTDLDPTAGLGAGAAPIGAAVTVRTTTPLAISVSAQIVDVQGYSLSGAGGTVSTIAGVQASIQNYLLTLNPGDTLHYQRLLGAILAVPGVGGVNQLTVNGAAHDIVLTLTPAQTPQLDLPLILSETT